MRYLLLFLLLVSSLFADTYLVLKGYLGDEELPTIHERITEISKHEKHGIVIHLRSSTGNLQDVFDIARRLHKIKTEKHLKIVVFIEERAIGPAAMIPFLADELYVTPMAVWGDIPYGVNHFVGHQLMQRAIKQLITSERPVYGKLVDAMIDPTHKIAGIQEDGFQPIVLNVQDMEKLKLVSEVVTRAQFQKLYPGIVAGQFDIVSSQALDEAMDKRITVYPDGPNYFGYIRFDENYEISPQSYVYAKFAIEEYNKRNVQAILLHLDSPGGSLLASIKIAELLQKADIEYQLPVICFIDNWALSSAAMLPYASRFIGITKEALMGAMPESISEKTGIQPISSRVNNALRSEFAALAKFYDREPIVAEAMVDKNILLVIRNDKIVQLQSPKEILPSDQILTEKGKPLTMNADHLLHSSTADFALLPKVLPKKTPAELREGIWPANKELVFQQSYLKTIPNAMILEAKSWKIPFYQFMIRPFVAPILIMGLLLSLYWQFSSRKFSVASILALFFLTLTIMTSFAIHIVGWVELIVLFTGVLLVLVELFVIPGYRIAGIFGAILMLIGLIIMLLPGIELIEFTHIDSLILLGGPTLINLLWIALGLVLTFAVIYLLRRFQGRELISIDIVKSDDEKLIKAQQEKLLERKLPDVGVEGESHTKLDPRGQVLIDAQLFDAIAESGTIERGDMIEVKRIEAYTLVVQKKSSN
ncbi:MAG: hypothetical protein SP1CHLAM54_06060 [Chlamydiia bacterium]|nr:hypothetical protein [Chlamydiia bacterium]MCH9615516.1 hypothetical protein [Chlamydiia bacterium]MCH9629171.1 hypothetical protein [Chlamydiia bacterium]